MDQPTAFGPKTARRILDKLDIEAGVNDISTTARSPLANLQFRPRNVFQNESAETIPAFGLVKITGITVESDRYFFEVDKPDGDLAAAHLVNGPREVAAGDRGSYQDASNLFVIRTDEATGAVGPGSDWPAVAGGMFRVLGQIQSTAPKLVLATRALPLFFAQAPSGGIPARSGGTPGTATCEILTYATESGTGYAIGDLVKSGQTMAVKNWSLKVAAADGDRILQFDGASIVGFDCDNDGDPDDFEELESSEVEV